MILAVSLGNTNLRFALFEESEPCRDGVLPLVSGESIALTSCFAGEPIDAIVVVSVHPSRGEEVERELGTLGSPVALLGRDFDVPLINLYDDPDQVGVDRLLAVLAALERFPGEGVVVLDFGTALTVNVGSPEREFLGGYIGIGLGTAARALSEHAPRLPSVLPLADDQEPFSRGLPRETSSAIREGLALEVAGGVERILSEARRRFSWPFHVVATGGDARAIASVVTDIEVVDPLLVLRGLVASFQYATERGLM